MTQYLSPRNDYGFKKLFGNEDHKDLTMSFLNAVLDLKKGSKITEIFFQETEKLPEPADGRRCFLDVHCVDEQGKHFIIEMQNKYQSSFFARIIYYTSLVYSRQLPSPFKYDKLVPVIFVAVVNHIIQENYPEVISEHAIMNTKHHSISSEQTMYYLVELPKFTKKADELNSDVDKWLFFMKQAEKFEEIPEVLKNDKKFVSAFDILERMKWTDADLLGYLAAEDAASREDRIYSGGFELGEKKGKEEGFVEAQELTVVNLLKMGMDCNFMAQATNLTVNEVERIVQKIKNKQGL